VRIGVDIGGTKIAAGVVTADGAVLAREHAPTPRSGGADVMDAVCAAARRLLGRAGPAVTGIGVGAPGVVDPGAGVIRAATDVLPGWAGTDVAGPLRDATGLPVAVENDVRAAALGEARRGAGAGFDRLLVVSVGTGIGGALVFGGRLQRGGHGTAGELAHLLVPGDGPIRCGCGRLDHLEAHASGPAIAAADHAEEGAAGAPGPLPAVVDRWRAGDELAGAVINSAARLIGRAVAGLAGAVDVDAVLVTGGVARIGEDFLAPLRSAFAESVIGPLRQIRVLAGSLAGDAPLIGAAELFEGTRCEPGDSEAGRGRTSRTAERWRCRMSEPAGRSGNRDAAGFLDVIGGTLIVSCQAPDGHPLRDTGTIVRLARAAAAGGASAIRCGGYGGLADIAAVAAAVPLPVIGLTKEGTHGVFITPSVASAVAVARAGAAVVAIDATARPRPDGSTVADAVDAVHAAGRLVMADVSTLAEGVAAAAAGADLISTTLAGYMGPSPIPAGPDLRLVSDLRAALPDAAITAEGRYRTPDEAAAALRAGADAVIVGTAITDPAWITARFAAAVRGSSR
jgi:predicted NBD/HSP70 family sugar kinase/putative N-acetylmannosamine-6-phosphate epimerase